MLELSTRHTRLSHYDRRIIVKEPAKCEQQDTDPGQARKQHPWPAPADKTQQCGRCIAHAADAKVTKLDTLIDTTSERARHVDRSQNHPYTLIGQIIGNPDQDRLRAAGPQ